ncbi:T9SS type A sorting domain-containing protein [Spirosoma sp. BT702]|uniref:T9SS type A sorting domain-containing protein n=1 Tax=Spirosoma profusum TaxID=2771354 RepID=A0A926Y214_9BACT|nr:T9SS type A sorting domain-containing protein [Spirosoma profusum]MBD2700625.1 T9SS type A sorting domain-containing protein [Spirosoma profusum]
MELTFLRQFNFPFISRLLCGLWLLLSGPVVFAQSPLSLPFFDDFSTATGRPGIDLPDPARWLPGSGVYINNTMAINQPTVNVATFDGLAQNGRPYQVNNPLAQDYTDTLASRPINLAGLTARDSVYLSFYWQIRGLGELPDAGDSASRQAADSLTLQFLDNTGTWRTAWARAGGTINNNFLQAFVPIRSPAFFHGNFAFRFRSFGRASGPFDTWHIDYIYLNRGRSVNDQFVKDVATRQPLTPFLKRYTAMPLSQYVANPAAETADSVTTDINNLFNNFNFTTFRFTVRDEVSGRTVQDDPQTSSVLIAALSSQRKSAKPRPVTDLGTATRAALRYKVDVLTTDDQNPSIPGVNLRRNDTISSVAVLDDYYAYDDGTWEYAQQIRQREQIAVRFILNKSDAIGGVRACIVPFTTNQTGQAFVIKVFTNNGGRPGTAIYSQSFPTQYPTTRNGFVEFKFTKTVSVKDTFYLGYQQISSTDTTLLRIGFDKNSPFGGQIFYNGGTNWEQNLASSSLNVPGAFMLRPVMGARPDNVITATPEPLTPLLTYPNPTSGLLRWEHPSLTRLEMLNTSGRVVVAVEPSRGQQTLDVSYLPDGLYLVRLFADQRTAVQKIIIQK